MKKNILLVEADPGLRRRFKTFLEWENFKVLVVEDESEALLQLQRSPGHFQLVITSIKASDTDQQGLIAGLKESKVLFLTDPRSDPLALECENYVAKPEVPEALVSHVRRVFFKERRHKDYVDF